MGTHPIFESDFDCLTECSPVLQPVVSPFQLNALHTQHGSSTTATSRMVNGLKWNSKLVVPKRFGSQLIPAQRLLPKLNSTIPESEFHCTPQVSTQATTKYSLV